jgi:hypothetical protein
MATQTIRNLDFDCARQEIEFEARDAISPPEDKSSGEAVRRAASTVRSSDVERKTTPAALVGGHQKVSVVSPTTFRTLATDTGALHRDSGPAHEKCERGVCISQTVERTSITKSG